MGLSLDHDRCSVEELMDTFMGNDKLKTSILKDHYYNFIFNEYDKKLKSFELESDIEDFVEETGLRYCKVVAIAPVNDITHKMTDILYSCGVKKVIVFDCEAQDGVHSYDEAAKFSFDKFVITADTDRDTILRGICGFNECNIELYFVS